MLKLGEKGTILQRDKKTYAIAPHMPCGVISPKMLRTIADTAEKFGCEAIKITSAGRMALIGLNEEDIDAAWEKLGMPVGHAVGLCVRSVKACPGNRYCRLGLMDSLSMGLLLDREYHGMNLPGKTKIGVSGCTNMCAENWIKDISLYGRKKGWSLMAGGSGARKPRIAELLAEGLETEEAVSAIKRIVAFYRENGKKNERIGQMMDRIGIETFQSAVV